jgi:tetratricopeptide (TPR) repeat protein
VAAWIRQIATFLGFVAKLPPTRPRAGEPTGPPTDLERFLLDRAGVATTDQEAYGELNVLGLTGSQAMQAGDLQAAERDFTRSLELARRIHHTASIVKACGSLGLVKAKMGRPREALPYLEEAIAVARENGLAVEEGQTLDHLAGAYADLGDKDRALALYEDRLALARRTGDRIGMAYGSANVGVIHFEKQEFREAAERLQEAAGLFEPFGMGPDLARVYAYLGCTYQALGDAQGCIRAYWAHIELCRQMGDPASAAGSLANLSGVLYSLGKREDAIALAEEACDYLGRMWSPQGASLRARLERWKRGEPS